MRNCKIRNLSCIALISGLIFITGCSTTSTDPVRVEQDYGNSVRNMVQAQILDPEAAENPPEEAPTGLDGRNAEAVLKSYRGDVSKPKQVDKPVQININK